MTKSKALRWYPGDTKPDQSGQFLLELDDGDYAVDNCFVPGGSWITLRTVVRWARLADRRGKTT